MARGVRDMLLNFLEAFGSYHVMDEAVLEYACCVLQSTIEDEGGDDEESLTHLDALLVGACGEPYEKHAKTERHEQLATILQQARRSPPAALSSQPPNASALASQLRETILSSCGGQSASLRGENLFPVGEQPEPLRASAVVEELAVLCSGAVSTGFLQYALERKFHMNAEALAAWLLDSDRAELQTAEAQWEEIGQRELQDEEAARLLKERNKQQILQRFDLRPVMLPKDPKKTGKSTPSLRTGKHDQQAQQPKVRYLDGRVVSTKGEKFVIERTGEEWDGGSRGKVYTKGKRGKGFV